VNIKSLVLSGVGVVIGSLLMITVASSTHEYDEHTESKELAEYSIDIGVSDSFVEIWQGIKQVEEKLFVDIREKKLDKIHEHSLMLQKLLTVLINKTNESLGLNENIEINSQIEKTIGQVKFLHKWGDSEKLNSAQMNWIALKDYLKDLEILYPENIFTEEFGQKDSKNYESQAKIKNLSQSRTFFVPILAK